MAESCSDDFHINMGPGEKDCFLDQQREDRKNIDTVEIDDTSRGLALLDVFL